MKLLLAVTMLFLSLASCSDDDKKSVVSVPDDTTKTVKDTTGTTVVDTTKIDTTKTDTTVTPIVVIFPDTILPAPTYTGMVSADSIISPFAINTMIGKGVNLGNCFEGTDGEGSWGVTLEESYFKMLSDSGFTSIRVPIRWYIQTADEAPYSVDSTFFARIDWVIDNAYKNNLMVIINQHHYDPLYKDFDGNIDEFLSIWGQIAHRYQNYPQNLVFEIMNEPREDVTGANLTTMMQKAVDTIRVTNPQRKLIVSGDEWGGIAGLAHLKLPKDDNLIASIHYYDPHSFTHQGTTFGSDMTAYIGTKWENTFPEQMVMMESFQIAADYSKKNNIPIFLGEFGSYYMADSTSRFLWTQYVQNLATHFGFSTEYWEYCSSFGIYDAKTGEYKKFLMDALLRNDNVVVTRESRPLDTTFLVLDDFENANGDNNAMNAIYAAKGIAQGLEVDSLKGGYWYAFWIETSTFLSATGDTILAGDEDDKEKLFGAYGVDGSNALSAKINIKGDSYPWIGIGSTLADKENGKVDINLSNLTAVSFWAKGEGELRLKFGTTYVDSTKDWGAHGKDFSLEAEWKQFKIFADELTPMAYSDTEANDITWDVVKNRVNEFQFINASSYGEEADEMIDFTVDNIKLHGLTTADFGF